MIVLTKLKKQLEKNIFVTSLKTKNMWENTSRVKKKYLFVGQNANIESSGVTGVPFGTEDFVRNTLKIPPECDEQIKKFVCYNRQRNSILSCFFRLFVADKFFSNSFIINSVPAVLIDKEEKTNVSLYKLVS